MSNSKQIKLKNRSNSKDRTNMIKNMTGMSDPAFQSNNTLKRYVNQKLGLYLEQRINLISKTKNFKNNNHKFEPNIPLQEYFMNESSSKMNCSSNSLNINLSLNKRSKKNSINLKPKNNSFIILRYNNYNNNKLLSKQKKKGNENLISLNLLNDNISNCNIFNTPINLQNKENKTTPINNINKTKSIYKSKHKYLNRSLGIENIKGNTAFQKKRKDDKNFIMNQKLNNNNTPKSPLYKNSSTQIKLLKQEINKIINNKTLYNNFNQLNNSYYREESKLSQNNNIKLLKYKNIFSFHKKISKNEEDTLYDKNSIDKDNLLKDKINDLLKNDESYNENKCPVPMPYVKKYSDNLIKDNNSNNANNPNNVNNANITNINNTNDSNDSNNNENINLDNFFMNKYLKEPKEEKKIPLPISQSINLKYLVKNKKEKKIL